MSNSEIPQALSGSCLCKAVSYHVHIPTAQEWSAMTQCATCQCTQCRKFTGGLVAHLMELPQAWITWSESSSQSLREYNSSPGCYRGFCGQCGSSISWRNQSRTGNIELFMGSFDESCLIGEKVSGEGPERKGGYGSMLAKAEEHNWFQNAIPGVTDHLEGKRFAEESESG